MPIYEYRCEECGATFDKFVRSMTAAVEVECPKCHSRRCKKDISLCCASVAGGASDSASPPCATSGGG